MGVMNQVAQGLIDMAKRIESMDLQLATTTKERDRERSTRESLTRSIIAACEGTGCVNAYELRKKLERLKKERDDQAEAVRVLGRGLFNRCFLGYDHEWAAAEIARIQNPIARAAVKGGEG